MGSLLVLVVYGGMVCAFVLPDSIWREPGLCALYSGVAYTAPCTAAATIWVLNADFTLPTCCPSSGCTLPPSYLYMTHAVHSGCKPGWKKFCISSIRCGVLCVRVYAPLHPCPFTLPSHALPAFYLHHFPTLPPYYLLSHCRYSPIAYLPLFLGLPLPSITTMSLFPARTGHRHGTFGLF